MISIEQLVLIVNTFLVPIAIFSFKSVNNWKNDICDRLERIEHKLNFDHGKSG